MTTVRAVTDEELDAAKELFEGAWNETDAERLNARLTHPQPGVTEALELLVKAQNAHHLREAFPVVYTLLEAAGRAFPADFAEPIRPKAYVTCIASIGQEARAVLADAGQTPSPSRERQPALGTFVDAKFVAEGALPASTPTDHRIGLTALGLATIVAIQRHVEGVQRPAIAAHVPGRNDPCHCGSARKFKKCHGASAGVAA
jgi:hypothetical protein